MAGEIYDTFFNPPPARSEEEYNFMGEEEKYECPVCGAPYGSCMDIVFEKDFGVPNHE